MTCSKDAMGLGGRTVYECVHVESRCRLCDNCVGCDGVM